MIKSCRGILNLWWQNTIKKQQQKKNMLLSLILSKNKLFFHCEYPQLTMYPICLYHNMTAFRLLLSAKAACLLSVTKQHSETTSPFSIIMQNAFRTRNAHRENYSSGEIF